MKLSKEKPKDLLRIEINRAMEDFFSQGGKIKKVENQKDVTDQTAQKMFDDSEFVLESLENDDDSFLNFIKR